VRPHRRHHELHRASSLGWLRAAVLGSNDAIVSVASLLVGVGETTASRQAMLITGVAGLVAGAMSMAVGEYVSVSSQRDAESADIAKETAELEEAPDAELHELAGIYVRRGLDRDLAMQVARQLSDHDRLGAHLRDELGIVETARARPLQAAWVSAASFSTFALVPIAALAVAPSEWRVPVIAVVTLIALGALGALGGWLGGASPTRAAARVVGGGALALAITSGIGRLLGVAL
jgi:VIT1/CCC1 family predicted Fe2+/Mn2+ transporter